MPLNCVNGKKRRKLRVAGGRPTSEAPQWSCQSLLIKFVVVAEANAQVAGKENSREMEDQRRRTDVRGPSTELLESVGQVCGGGEGKCKATVIDTSDKEKSEKTSSQERTEAGWASARMLGPVGLVYDRGEVSLSGRWWVRGGGGMDVFEFSLTHFVRVLSRIYHLFLCASRNKYTTG